MHYSFTMSRDSLFIRTWDTFLDTVPFHKYLNKLILLGFIYNINSRVSALVYHFVDGGFLVTWSRNNVLVICWNIAAQNWRRFLGLKWEKKLVSFFIVNFSFFTLIHGENYFYFVKIMKICTKKKYTTWKYIEKLVF